MSGVVYSGTEWLDRYMQTQARVAAEALFAVFGLGNLGATAAHDPERARAMIAALRIDADDLETAAKDCADTLRAIVANVERTLDEGAP